jgi:hypothetical protein
MTSRPPDIPNFLIGGSIAGGTSFLSNALLHHPDVFLPRITRPEPGFFCKSWEYAKSLDYYRQKWFADYAGQPACGERSSLYLHGGETVARRIKASLPEVKLIFTLRNPIERAYGNYRFTVLEGLEELSFEDALEKEDSRLASLNGTWAEIQPCNYAARGKYSEQLAGYLRHFARPAILLVKSEEMARDPVSSFRKVLAFLGIGHGAEKLPLPEDYTSRSVKDPARQKYFREHFGERYLLFVEALRRNDDPMQYARDDQDRAQIRDLMENLCDAKVPMSERARSYLRSYYNEEFKRLAALVDFPIIDWK